jgi:hypothetical protein
MHRFSLALPPFFAFALACAFGLAASGCGGNATTDGSIAPTAPPGSTARNDSGLAPDGACNALTQMGAPVAIEAVPAAPPQPRGGALADGSYVVTRATLYTGVGGAAGATSNSIAVTIRIANGVVETFAEGMARSATFEATGAMLTTTDTCPDHDVVKKQSGYTASGATIDAFVVEGAKTLVETFTRL